MAVALIAVLSATMADAVGLQLEVVIKNRHILLILTLVDSSKMSLTVVFEVQPELSKVTEDGVAVIRQEKASPSNFPIDQAKGKLEYSYTYNFDTTTGGHISNTAIDKAVTSIYIREFIKDFRTTITTTTNNKLIIPIEARFRPVFATYLDFLRGQQTDIIGKNQLITNLQLADWLNDEVYINYAVQKIFDNWTNLMAAVVYSGLYPELRHVIFLRAPYFLLPEDLTGDKHFMTDWFARHRNGQVVIDKKFLHHINKVDMIKGLGQVALKKLINYYTEIGSQNLTTSSVSFYADSHRVHSEWSTKVVNDAWVQIGEFTKYANDDHHTIIEHGYSDQIGKKTGVWLKLVWDNMNLQTLYQSDKAVGPSKVYYPSGNVSNYIPPQDSGAQPDGVYPFYEDNVDSTIYYEYVLEDGLEVESRRYLNGRLRMSKRPIPKIEFAVDDWDLDYVEIYYQDSGVLKSHFSFPPGSFFYNQIEVDLINGSIVNANDVMIHVTNFYNSQSWNKESVGQMLGGTKIGLWRYYNDDADNTVNQVVDYS